MNKQQSGFTLIELIMVIVVLGALAVTVLPKYVDLQADAQGGVAQGIAGSIASASAINFAACKAGNASCVNPVADCASFGPLLVSGALPAGYVITADTGTATAASGSSYSCFVTGDGTAVPASVTATASVLIP